MTWIGLLSLAAWLYLLSGRGLFWRMRERDGDFPPLHDPAGAPSVVAVVPARDEADVIACAVTSLLLQDYPGPFRVVLVDDGSSDETAEAARRAARACGCGDRLEILTGSERPAGWTGKVWAMKQGFAFAQSRESPAYVLFTDADIAHAGDDLSRLIAHAESRQLVLSSLMAKLHCRSLAEKLLIPAFVFFFAMLFPFAWVNDPARRTAAAAGGCMLVRAERLNAAGGLDRIAGAIIDDCALAAVLKPHGPIWLGISNGARSIRTYDTVGEVARMVSRSAYAQLHYSPVLLCGTVAGMTIVYAAPLLLSLTAHGPPRILGALAWILMAVLLQPTLRFYRVSAVWGVALPITGALYGIFTLQSAMQHWRGRGGMWKGRAQAAA